MKTVTNETISTISETLGEKRIGVRYEEPASTQNSLAKSYFAKAIDQLQGLRNNIAVHRSSVELSPEAYHEKNGELLRLIAEAQTKAEEASMWADKAITAGEQYI